PRNKNLVWPSPRAFWCGPKDREIGFVPQNTAIPLRYGVLERAKPVRFFVNAFCCSASQLPPSGRSAESFSLLLAQTHAWATTVLINELDAGGFERAAYSQVIGCGHRGFVLCEFSAADCGHA